MAVRIIMPKAGMAMEEGTIVKWLKKEGEKVEVGEPLIEIHTDKVNMEVEALVSGTLLKIIGQEGDVIPVTETIGYIGQPGEKIEEDLEGNKPAIGVEWKAESHEDITETRQHERVGMNGKIAATPLARTLAKESRIDLSMIKGTGKSGEIKARDIYSAKNIEATPLAKRIAEKNHIDLERIQGSGYKGKVRKEDIIMVETTSKADDPQAIKREQIIEAAEKKPLTGIRKIIAERMLASHLLAPPVTLNTKADVTALALLKEQLKVQTSLKLSFNDFIIKAAAKALIAYPNVNVSLDGEEILLRKNINIGMAVALEEGLIVPVIKDADRLTLRDLAEKTKELAQKGREGKLLPGEVENGSFTVSNLGMYDILSFTPIINQPESAILGVCAIDEELKMIDGKIENRKMMGLSLTVDHRLIDGAQGAIFLKHIKTLLENPLEILV
ncbi:2-oxo acid dehydrogenase subunit E2 [Geosporobacter ferrireducens]|uniref:Dihydrolipoamide acetyltransferase component of pyruvate dehydrogenase complex n=1 Tax=Geosporobacter ferrireducens TaxID=1424294 RepID=A0A1D8GJN7_9FIRM|nr:2-oxo acid dehydrogenase subunit E2 [Geosporobacter ferrireducens]AOT71138.1 hypothetical protein Gferi_17220 [Geosporobacter ferrireducens]MTI57947.1 2-oxo acid dehydrogenase subunit E2 [Geosporobacter ferrireducens]